MMTVTNQKKLKTIQQFDILHISSFISVNNVSNKSVFNVRNGYLYDFKVELLQKKQKSGGQMMLIEIALVLNCIETESSIILFKKWRGDFRKMSTARFIDNILLFRRVNTD